VFDVITVTAHARPAPRSLARNRWCTGTANTDPGDLAISDARHSICTRTGVGTALSHPSPTTTSCPGNTPPSIARIAKSSRTSYVRGGRDPRRHRFAARSLLRCLAAAHMSGHGTRIWSVRRDSRATIWATRAAWRGAVRLGAGRFGLRRPSSSAIVHLASFAQCARGATTPGRMAARSTASGPCRQGKYFSFRGCIRGPMGHPPGPTTCTAVRGAPPLRKKVVSSQRTTKAKARRSHSLPPLTYSAPGGLRQDPGRAAESAAGPRTDEDWGPRRACVVVDGRGTR
jgi:hypothetical protein